MKYSIGDYVIVSGYMFRKDNHGIYWVSLSYRKSRLGQIVGLATRYDGSVEGGITWEDPSYFVPGKAHTFWQVKLGYLNKPILVLEEHIRLAAIDEIEELPRLFQNRISWSEQSRKSLSLDSANWPRDSKGRWANLGMKGDKQVLEGETE